jgi:hypothetical protein
MIPGLVGFAAALAVVQVCAEPLGVPAALALGLGVSVGWNLILWASRTRGPNESTASPGESQPPI